MKKYVCYTLSVLVIATMFSFSGCRSTNRAVTLWPGDRNVTVVKRPKRKAIKGRNKAVTTTKYNRARK